MVDLSCGDFSICEDDSIFESHLFQHGIFFDGLGPIYAASTAEDVFFILECIEVAMDLCFRPVLVVVLIALPLVLGVHSLSFDSIGDEWCCWLGIGLFREAL